MCRAAEVERVQMTAPLASRSLFEPGTLVSGKYRIVSLIGVGGVGRVYLARHIELETEVAIKVLRPEVVDRPEVVQRFGREARASVRLHSPRIARVFDVGTHEGEPYFVMEYMVGCNLLEARRLPEIDIATLCEFFIQACEGLADAHAQGIVHRDVKPENLFVARDPSGWRSLKIFDFGISKFSLTGRYSDIDIGSLRTEAMMGTPHYISPEQIRSTHDVDHRSDIWSLGAVMFEVLTGGVLPFREEREVTALVAEVLEQPHRSLLDVAPNIPEALAAIVNRCLVKDRNQRYQTTAEVALDLLPLAPARARASAERAVSVMQAAGLMALNGDLESLRSTLPPSAPSRVSSTDSPSLVLPEPASGRRPSASMRASAVVGTIERGQPIGSASRHAALHGKLPTPEPSALARRPPATPAPLARGGESFGAATLVAAVDDDSAHIAGVEHEPPFAFDPAKRRRRNAILVLALIALLLLAIAALLLRQGDAADRAHQSAPSATPSALEAPNAGLVAPPSALGAGSLPPVVSAVTSAEPAVAPKPSKPAWVARPVPALPAPKPAAPKPADLPPPTTRPELRRER